MFEHRIRQRISFCFCPTLPHFPFSPLTLTSSNSSWIELLAVVSAAMEALHRPVQHSQLPSEGGNLCRISCSVSCFHHRRVLRPEGNCTQCLLSLASSLSLMPVIATPAFTLPVEKQARRLPWPTAWTVAAKPDRSGIREEEEPLWDSICYHNVIYNGGGPGSFTSSFSRV